MVCLCAEDGGDSFQKCRVAANILNKQSQSTRGSPPARGLGEGITTPHHKTGNHLVMKCYTEPQIWTGSLE